MDRGDGVEEGAFFSWRRRLFLPLDEKNPRDRRGARTIAGKRDVALGREGVSWLSSVSRLRLSGASCGTLWV